MSQAVVIRLTIEDFATRVGMSSRNVRALQARKLLTPPEHVGRRAYYKVTHLKRVEAIQRLQRQGFNLAAIAAMLGDGPRSPRTGVLSEFLTRIDSLDPSITRLLAYHGVLRRQDGGVVPLRPQLINAALALQNLGMSAPVTLQLLGNLLDDICGPLDRLVHDASVRIIASCRQGETLDSGESEGGTHVLAATIVALLDEVFRIVAETVGARSILELLDEHGYRDRVGESAVAVDVG